VNSIIFIGLCLDRLLFIIDDIVECNDSRYKCY